MAGGSNPSQIYMSLNFNIEREHLNFNIEWEQISPTLTRISYCNRVRIPNEFLKPFLALFIYEKLTIKYLIDHSIFESRQELIDGCEEIWFTLEAFHWDKTTSAHKTIHEGLKWRNSERLPTAVLQFNNETDIEDYLGRVRGNFTAEFFHLYSSEGHIDMNSPAYQYHRHLYESCLDDKSFKLSKIIINLEYVPRKKQKCLLTC